jgi:hypothetical protein
MAQKRLTRKRPCRICGKWFVPNPRLGDRQKSCGDPECQRQWHARTCAAWNRRNRSIFRENYLKRKLEALNDVPSEPPPSLTPPPVPIRPVQHRSPLDYSWRVVQEVMGAQQLVIIEHIIRLLKSDVQEVIRSQIADIQSELRRLHPADISRGDSQSAP